MSKKSVSDVELGGKRVLLRVDFNVPLGPEREILDDTRIRAHLPTINYIISKGAKLIVASHLGRPKGKVVPELSLAPVAKRLDELLEAKVRFVDDCVGPKVASAVDSLGVGEILLLENTRFKPGETENSPELAKQFAMLCDVYVDDAFSAAHRAHASVAAVAKFVPESVEGFLMEKEVFNLGKLLQSPVQPFIVILGGAKVKDKIGLISHLIGKVDTMAIGGGMCFTFLKAKGLGIGDSLLDEEHLRAITSLLDEAESMGTRIVLPIDIVVAEDVSAEADVSVVPADKIPDGQKGLDIGPQTVNLFVSMIEPAATVFWNGPMGVFEKPAFAKGTMAVAKALARASGTTVVGGGETVSAVRAAGVADRITHISTGGGASLEFLAGETLPGIAVLDDI
ncbi:MAG: phosphoglycerate kinase [Candidatus Coatesbacteria bacterium]|nr:MAG: phosphoglycerate kinase [Candidatus Coatesbacteria bacterium]HDM59221.1 phosphoglycerate kinase [Bacillota bacterium]